MTHSAMRATTREALGATAGCEQRREKLPVQPQATGEQRRERLPVQAQQPPIYRPTQTAIETSLMHEERAMGSSNGNVAVAELKYKPMQSRCEAAQFSTRGVHVPPPPGTDRHTWSKHGN